MNEGWRLVVSRKGAGACVCQNLKRADGSQVYDTDGQKRDDNKAREILFATLFLCDPWSTEKAKPLKMVILSLTFSRM